MSNENHNRMDVIHNAMATLRLLATTGIDGPLPTWLATMDVVEALHAQLAECRDDDLGHVSPATLRLAHAIYYGHVPRDH